MLHTDVGLCADYRIVMYNLIADSVFVLEDIMKGFLKSCSSWGSVRHYNTWPKLSSNTVKFYDDWRLFWDVKLVCVCVHVNKDVDSIRK